MPQVMAHSSKSKKSTKNMRTRPKHPRIPASSPRSGTRAAPKTVSVVSARLAEALEEAGFSKSLLARLLAGPDAPVSKVEAQRRLILKWLTGTQPGLDYASRLSDIFGKAPDHFLAVEVVTPEQDAVEFARAVAQQLRSPDDEPITGPLKRDQIAELFPQFNRQHLLVDYVEQIEPGEHVQARRFEATKDWPPMSFYYTADMIPGFVLAEALAQTAAIALLAQPENRKRTVLCAAFNGIRFKQVVHAEDEVELEAQITRVSGAIAHADVEASVGGVVAVHGRLTLAVVD